MLSYDDSRELERLGYPQELKDGDWFWRRDDPGGDYWLCLYSPYILEELGLDPVRVPTTDGMIEGLRPGFYSLQHVTDFHGTLRWFASTFHKKKVITTYGDTYAQALCELWKKVKGK